MVVGCTYVFVSNFMGYVWAKLCDTWPNYHENKKTNGFSSKTQCIWIAISRTNPVFFEVTQSWAGQLPKVTWVKCSAVLVQDKSPYTQHHTQAKTQHKPCPLWWREKIRALWAVSPHLADQQTLHTFTTKYTYTIYKIKLKLLHSFNYLLCTQ